METIKSYQEQVHDIIEEYNKIKNNPQKILELHDFKERLDEIAYYVSEEYLRQSVIFSDNKSEFTYLVRIKEDEMMELKTHNNKKMTSAYANTIAERKYIELKRNYIKAEGIKDGLEKFLYRISGYAKNIELRIASLKKTY